MAFVAPLPEYGLDLRVEEVVCSDAVRPKYDDGETPKEKPQQDTCLAPDDNRRGRGSGEGQSCEGLADFVHGDFQERGR